MAAISTGLLYRNGLVNCGRKRRHNAQGTTAVQALLANEPWCANYKGEFMLTDKRYWHQLTISDFATC